MQTGGQLRTLLSLPSHLAINAQGEKNRNCIDRKYRIDRFVLLEFWKAPPWDFKALALSQKLPIQRFIQAASECHSIVVSPCSLKEVNPTLTIRHESTNKPLWQQSKIKWSVICMARCLDNTVIRPSPVSLTLLLSDEIFIRTKFYISPGPHKNTTQFSQRFARKSWIWIQKLCWHLSTKGTPWWLDSDGPSKWKGVSPFFFTTSLPWPPHLGGPVQVQRRW